MTQQEAKTAPCDDGVAAKDVRPPGPGNGSGKTIPVETENEPDMAYAVSAGPDELITPGDTGAAMGATGDQAAAEEGEAAEKAANGGTEAAVKHDSAASEQVNGASEPAAAEAAPSLSDPISPGAPVSEDIGVVEPSTEPEKHAASPAPPVAPGAAAGGAGTSDVKMESAGTESTAAEPPAGNTSEDKAEIVLNQQNGTAAEVANPEADEKQVQPGSSTKDGKEQRAETEHKEAEQYKPQQGTARASGEDSKRDSPTQVETPSKAPTAQPSEPKTTSKKDARPTAELPKVAPAETSTASASAGQSISPKATPFMSPPGTVQALSRRLSSNSLATPPPKSTSEKQLGSGGGSGASVGAALGGRSTKSPTGSKSGESSPASTHDTKNTINVSQLLKLGAFKLQPLKDFVSYEELQRLRLEDGIDATRKEDYLNDEDFQQVFGMDRDAFKKQPAWRQAQAKKKANLF